MPGDLGSWGFLGRKIKEKQTPGEGSGVTLRDPA